MSEILEDEMEPISLADAAKIANVTPEALRHAAQKTKTLKAKKKGRNWFTTRAWVAAWMASQEHHKTGRPRS